ncbi:Cna protein B-type domain protein [bacterium BMS3Abin05]|nr:Cna protein B-type domain protein [bacterium BMS3Abin05]GBE28927.1 Cna protein B-type domain protein [bacterium BMS3Bbin03]
MKKGFLRFGWLFLLGLFFLQPAQSAKADILMMTPDKAVMVPGEGQQFRVQLFNNRSMPVQMRMTTWKVMPDTLGTITEDGYFIAGDNPGEGMIVADMGFGNGMKVHARSKIIITDRRLPMRMEIFPKMKIAHPGDTLKFHVRAETVGGLPVPKLDLNWFVIPRNKGKISQKGVFVAGETVGEATVVAYTKFMGMRYKVEAKVYITPEGEGIISGLVQDEDSGLPIVGARVKAYRIGLIRWSMTAQTDSLGNYALNDLLPGTYVVLAAKKGYIPEYYKDVRFLREATPVKIDSAGTADGIDFHLNIGSVLKGTVWTEGDSVSLSGALVKATLLVNPLIRFHGVSDESGEFRLTGIPTGTYILSAYKDGYKKEYYDNVENPGNAASVSVTEPDSVENLNFTLETRSAITGQVVTSTGGPLPEKAMVFVMRLRANGSRHAYRRTFTDENGNYVLSVPAGNYIVGAMARGFGLMYFDNVTHFNDAAPVTVLEDQHKNGINFSLDPLASLSGKVVDQATGSPIGNAIVEAFSETWHGRPYRIRTADDGSYTIPDVRPGIYVLVAKAGNYLPEFYEEASRLKDAKLIKVVTDTTIADVNFTLSRAAIVTGRVTDEASGMPVSHAVVKAKRIDSAFYEMVFTTDEGAYRFEKLIPGKYIIMAIAKGHSREFYLNTADRDSAAVLEITDSDSLGGINFTLQKAPVQGGIAGYVFSDADSLPISGAWVMAFPKKAGRSFLTVTGPAGEYKFTNLHSGNYFVMAWARGFTGEFYDNVRNWKNADPVPVTSPDITPGINFGLKPVAEGAYTIAGRIMMRSNHQPLDYAFVYARGPGGIAGFAVADNNGLYAITNIPAGHYKVFAMRVGFWQNLNGNMSQNDSLAVSVGSGESYDDANITMSETAITGVSEEGSGSLPESYTLRQNYPNPFNPETNIRYAIPQSGHVTVTIFNLLGEKVVTLENADRAAGVYTLHWKGLNDAGLQVSSGVYLLRIQVKNSSGIAFRSVKKMMLMR